MPSQRPNRIRRGIEPALENTGIRGLATRAGPDHRAVRIGREDRGSVQDADPGKDTRFAQIVDLQIGGSQRSSRGQLTVYLRKRRGERSKRLWCKGLVHGAKGFFPDEPENFGNTQVGLYDLGVTERDHLAAGIQALRKTSYLRVRVRSDGGAMLIIKILLEKKE